MPTHILPGVFDLTATSGDAIDTDVGQAVVAGDSWTLSLTVLDANGDPFDLTGWVVEASLRDAWVYDGGTVQAAMAATVVDATLGSVELSMTPSQTGALTVQGGKWDVQVRNVSDPGWDVGFVQTVVRGDWALMKDATR